MANKKTWRTLENMCKYCNNLSHVNVLHKQQEECVNKTSTVNWSFRAWLRMWRVSVDIMLTYCVFAVLVSARPELSISFHSREEKWNHQCTMCCDMIATFYGSKWNFVQPDVFPVKLWTQPSCESSFKLCTSSLPDSAMNYTCRKLPPLISLIWTSTQCIWGWDLA